MLLVLGVVIVVCFLAALLPFLFPGAIIALFGKLLNDALGDPLWNLVPAARGILVTSGSGGPMLTLEGVLAVYMPLLAALLFLQRRR
jgi:hypothetical protein